MMKLIWLTDIHLNLLEQPLRESFYQKIAATCYDSVIISGDIAEATSIIDILKEMVSYLQKPIYFVAGNHDYYHQSIAEVRNNLTALIEKEDHLHWLPASGIQYLTQKTILLGEDGWADGRLGNFYHSQIQLRDADYITELSQAKYLGHQQLLKQMQQLCDQDAKKLQKNLLTACEYQPQQVIIITHVPPFKAASYHQGRINDDDSLPFFSAKIIGDVLTKIATEYPHIDFLVLCGHTHNKADYQPLANLRVKVGHAKCGQPQIQEHFIIQ